MSLLMLGGCVVLVRVIPFFVAGSQGQFVEDSEIFVETGVTVVPATVPEFSDVPTTVAPGVVPTTGEPGEPLPDSVGSLNPFGSVAEVAGVVDGGVAAVLDVMVEEPTDATEALLAAGALETAPVDGVVVVAVPAMVLVQDSSVGPLPGRGVFDWTIVGGATDTTYRPAEPGTQALDCQLLDNDLTAVEEFAVGVEEWGILCVTMPVVDFEHLETRVALTVGTGAPTTWGR